MRCWVRDHPVSESRLQDGSAARSILSKSPQLSARFDAHPDANPPSRAQRLLRWQMNPDRNWGPKARAAKSGSKDDSVEVRRLKGAKKADETRAKRKADVCYRFIADLLQKTRVFLKPNPLVFLVLLGFWVLLRFLDKQEKIGKIIQKLSNSKP